MPAVVEEVTRSNVRFEFPVEPSDKKVYSGLFKEFSESISEEHPSLAAEFLNVSKALVARKKKAATKKVAKNTKKKRPPRRAEVEVEIEEDDSDITEDID